LLGGDFGVIKGAIHFAGALSKVKPSEPVPLRVTLSQVHGLCDLISLLSRFGLNFPGFLNRFRGLQLLVLLADRDL